MSTFIGLPQTCCDVS